ncbi:SNF2 family N-terminal domain-containing protein [Xylariomycetidae sp. FL2044]|nr:SNF2 family N-terminal domain-containing protein [Xylariomycetidae sp. FL2044]
METFQDYDGHPSKRRRVDDAVTAPHLLHSADVCSMGAMHDSALDTDYRLAPFRGPIGSVLDPTPSNVAIRSNQTLHCLPHLNTIIGVADYSQWTPTNVAEQQGVYNPPLQEQTLKANRGTYSIPTADPGEDGAPTEKPSETVCFGMISEIPAKVDYHRSHNYSLPFPVDFESCERFKAVESQEIHGKVHISHGQMVQGLLDEDTLQLYATCHAQDKTEPLRKSVQIPCYLNITLYGPLELFDEIGTWFQEYETYLQDPKDCHMSVRYCNPQRLSAMDVESCPMVQDITSRPFRPLHMLNTAPRQDFLEILNNQVDLEETQQPISLLTDLKTYQRQALTFIMRREQGWVFDGRSADIWQMVDSRDDIYFVNTISNDYQIERPPEFYGGIIADPMGLGKTLTMISLIAIDRESQQDCSRDNHDDDIQHHPVTLVVVPPPLLGTWQEQIIEHVQPGAIQYRVHHGKTKLTQKAELNGIDMVLTTYHTVSAEWKSIGDNSESMLFSTSWKRIVLDEAHFIRNGNSRMAKALCTLESRSRWAVTGTPIQNRLSDLATLLRFIRAHPYTDPKQFEADFVHLWKSGKDEEAAKRLKRLSGCILLRRPKEAVDLPPRHDLLCPVDLTSDERRTYNLLRNQAINHLDEAIHHSSGSPRNLVYMNALQQIESLRLFCDLGPHYLARHDKTNKASSEEKNWAESAQSAFNYQREFGAVTCLQCSAVVSVTDTHSEDLGITDTTALFSECQNFICSDCLHRFKQTQLAVTCGHTPTCAFAPVSLGSNVLEEVSNQARIPKESASLGALSSKVESLISDLKAVPPDVKCIVFSTWRLTLDLVEAGLDQASFRSIRFDGKVPQKYRHAVVQRFNTDPSIKVMLLTLSCGAVGLTLTAASRAYLMEPHWNPTLEEQALARIHRLGQKREVTTIRFFVRDSFEEHVMQVQESKKNLAGVLLSPHDGGHSDHSLSALERLRSLL